MKILQLSDLHQTNPNDWSVLREGMKKQNLDLMVVNGDLSAPFISLKDAEVAKNAYWTLKQKIKGQEGREASFESIRKFCLKQDSGSDNHKLYQTYAGIEAKFNHNAEQSYVRVKKELDSFGIPYFVVPGNWDDALNYFKIFGEQNIQGKKKTFGGASFAGVGGASAMPKTHLPLRGTDFNDEALLNFLSEQDPDIAVTHTHPHLQKGDKGSMGALAYIAREKPRLFLCGHDHEPRLHFEGREDCGTLVVNAGSFGKYSNHPKHGNFAIIDYERNGKIDVLHGNIHGEPTGEGMPEQGIEKVYYGLKGGLKLKLRN
jgi:Icc-related predicted phosphoesterase